MIPCNTSAVKLSCWFSERSSWAGKHDGLLALGRSLRWQGMEEDLIQNLKGSVELNLDPAWSLLDGLPVVVRAPALDERQPENAEPEKPEANF